MVRHVYMSLGFKRLMPLANVHNFLLHTLSFLWFNALWLAVFCFANPLFLMSVSFLIYNHSIRNTARA